jgi:hypothetical protein
MSHANTKWPAKIQGPKRKRKGKIYIIEKEGHQRTSLEKRDQEVAEKKSDHDRTS